MCSNFQFLKLLTLWNSLTKYHSGKNVLKVTFLHHTTLITTEYSNCCNCCIKVLVKKDDVNTINVILSDIEEEEEEESFNDEHLSSTSLSSVDSAFVNAEEHWQRKPKK